MAFSGLFHVYIPCVAVVVEGRSHFIGLHSVLAFFRQSLRLEYCFIRYRLANEQKDESLAPVVLPSSPAVLGRGYLWQARPPPCSCPALAVTPIMCTILS